MSQKYQLITFGEILILSLIILVPPAIYFKILHIDYNVVFSITILIVWLLIIKWFSKEIDLSKKNLQTSAIIITPLIILMLVGILIGVLLGVNYY